MTRVDDDRRKMASIARSLVAIETDEVAGDGAVERARRDADEYRAARGIVPLKDALDPPEEEFYRRARALGLRRISR